MDSLWGPLIVAVLLFLWGYGDSIAGSHKVASRAREMLHKERLIAMEKGLPPPDGNFDEALLAYVSDDGGRSLDSRDRRWRAYGWAIALILGGIGWTFATIVISQTAYIGWLSDSFSFGLIPVLLGIGILFHTWLSKRV